MKLPYCIRTKQHSSTYNRHVVNRGIMAITKLLFNNFTKSIIMFQDQRLAFHLNSGLTGTVKVHPLIPPKPFNISLQ